VKTGLIRSFFVGIIITGMLVSIQCVFSPLSSVEHSEDIPQEQMRLEFIVEGGFGGTYENLTVNEDYTVSYIGPGYNIQSFLWKSQVGSIIESIYNNNFFQLDDEYKPSQPVMDDLTFTITYHSESKSKTVKASGASSGYMYIANIVKELNAVVDILKKGIYCGKVFVNKKIILEEWPFSDSVRISDSYNEKVYVSEEIFNHFKDYHNQDKKVVYFEGEWTYTVNGSGGYARSYSELTKGFYITFHHRYIPFRWPEEIGIQLNGIPEGGIFVTSSAYKIINELLENSHYPYYFIDDDLKTGNYIYQIGLNRGNGFTSFLGDDSGLIFVSTRGGDPDIWRMDFFEPLMKK